jgi:hypothetical protein
LNNHAYKKASTTYYRRYIDDLFLITDTLTDATTFIKVFNECNKSIQLDAITHDVKGIFLDIEISLGVLNKIHTKIYQKPNNKYQYLSPLSSHDQHIKDNFIYNEICRYKLYSSTNEDYLQQKVLFIKRLKNRGYTNNYIQNIINKTPDRVTLLNNIIKKNKIPVPKPIFLTYNPMIQIHDPPLREIIKLPEHILQSQRYKNLYDTNNKVIITKRLGKSLQGILCNKPLSSLLPSSSSVTADEVAV